MAYICAMSKTALRLTIRLRLLMAVRVVILYAQAAPVSTVTRMVLQDVAPHTPSQFAWSQMELLPTLAAVCAALLA